jgi:hypothetical protein
MNPTCHLTVLAFALFSLPLAAAEPARPLDPQARYQRESARCMAIRTHGERANCLSEASTALASTQPERLGEDPGRYARNLFLRCDALPDPERGDCTARMQGKGTISGSVAGGGIYRELVTREPVAVVPAASAAP